MASSDRRPLGLHAVELTAVSSCVANLMENSAERGLATKIQVSNSAGTISNEKQGFLRASEKSQGIAGG